MKLLLCVPIVNNPSVTKQFLYSVVGQAKDPNTSELLILANGAKDDIIQLIWDYQTVNPVTLWVEGSNIYVVPAWNRFLKHFLEGQYTHIAILNADLILRRNFVERLMEFWELYPDASPLAAMVNKEEIFYPENEQPAEFRLITSGYPGIAIALTRKQAEMVYPIPEDIKVWYGDDWCQQILNAMEVPTLLYNKLQVFHEGSATVGSVPGISHMINLDHEAWPLVQEKLNQRIDDLRSKNT